MPALIPTAFRGRVAWLGAVEDRGAGLAAAPRARLRLDFDGPAGDAHGGALRPACGRVRAQHRRGTLIRNVRQVSIVSVEELAQIAARLGLDRLDPAWIGATVMLSGLPDLSLLPPSSRLQGPDGATLVIDMANRPCHLPDPVIRAAAGRARLAARFRTAAKDRRGVTAWVEREGTLAVGDTLCLHVPDQPPWPHLAQARGMASRAPETSVPHWKSVQAPRKSGDMTDPASCPDMASLRRVIDDLDRRIVALLRVRQDCIDRAIELKPGEGLPARIDDRVAEVIARVREAAEAEGTDPELVEDLWRRLIGWSIAREEAVLERDNAGSPGRTTRQA